MSRSSEFKEEYVQIAQEYLENCKDKVTKNLGVTVNLPTISGLARHLGVARSSVYLWKAENKAFSDTLEAIMQEQEQRLLNNGLSGAYNPTIAKLVLSANHGLKERNDVTTDDKPIDKVNVTFQDFSDESETE